MELGLVAEMAIQGDALDASSRRDLAHGDRKRSALEAEPHGGLEDPVARLNRPAGRSFR
jgi:hypothetical protein